MTRPQAVGAGTADVLGAPVPVGTPSRAVRDAVAAIASAPAAWGASLAPDGRAVA